MIGQSGRMSSVAHVNGRAISTKDFQRKYRELHSQFAYIRKIAQSSGIPAETFLRMYGFSGDPQEAALDALVMEEIVKGIISPMNLMLHEDVVSEELLKALPPSFINADGSINMQEYRQLLRQRSISVSEFEDDKETEIRHRLYDDMSRHSAYATAYSENDRTAAKNMKKTFDVAHVSYDQALRDVEKAGAEKQALTAYYASHKDAYRVPENRSFSYWVLSPKSFESRVDVPRETAKRFYERNKSALYRSKVQVKVARLFIKDGDDAAERINDLRDAAVKDPASFVSLAETSSDESGDVVRDFFVRGTHGKEFEKAAFRLKETHELSPVVKTSAGYEVIQLLERISAKEKSFEEVVSDVENSVRLKRATEFVRSRLELIRKAAGNHKKAFDELVEYRDTSGDISLVAQGDHGLTGVEGKVVEHGYRLQKKDGYGFFLHEGSYVLYRFDEKRASYIPSYKDVAEKVSEDFFVKKAHERVAAQAKKMHAAALAGSALSQVAQEQGFTVERCDDIASSDRTTAPFRDADGLLEKAFALRSERQALMHTTGKDAYVATLLSSSTSDDKTEDESGAITTLESGAFSQSFIASLLRSATIETDRAMMQKRTTY